MGEANTSILGHTKEVNDKYYTFDMTDIKEKSRISSEILKTLDFPNLVEATGFEPTASASRTQRSTKLSHASSTASAIILTFGAFVKKKF